jgi:integrase
VRLFIPAGAPFDTSGLTERALREWLEEMDDVAPATVRKRGIGMGRFTAWLVGRGTLGLDPMGNILLPAQGDPLTHYLEVADVIRLADTVGGQIRLLEALLPASALEVSTALQVRVRAVSLTDKEIHAPGTKAAARNRVVRVAEFGLDALRELVKGKHPDSLLFDRIPHRWAASDANREAVDVLGDKGHRVYVEWEGKPKRYTLRDHRHTWAVRAARTGWPPAAIAEQLGHSDGGVLALRVYGRFAPKKEERDRWEASSHARDQELAAERTRTAGGEG